MPVKDAETYRYNVLDVTKVWPHGDYPLQPVGQLILNRNPTNYFQEVEQAAFSPGHFVPGIEASEDKMLQGRLFSYPDTHRHRLGGRLYNTCVSSSMHRSSIYLVPLGRIVACLSISVGITQQSLFCLCPVLLSLSSTSVSLFLLNVSLPASPPFSYRPVGVFTSLPLSLVLLSFRSQLRPNPSECPSNVSPSGSAYPRRLYVRQWQLRISPQLRAKQRPWIR